MKKSMILGLVILAGAAMAMTGCKSMSGTKSDGMSSGQHPAGCTCAACAMK